MDIDTDCKLPQHMTWAAENHALSTSEILLGYLLEVNKLTDY